MRWYSWSDQESMYLVLNDDVDVNLGSIWSWRVDGLWEDNDEFRNQLQTHADHHQYWLLLFWMKVALCWFTFLAFPFCLFDLTKICFTRTNHIFIHRIKISTHVWARNKDFITRKTGAYIPTLLQIISCIPPSLISIINTLYIKYA